MIADINLNSYDKILVAFSGGKDSLCCLLHLLELGYAQKIELHHHLVDGAPTEPIFFDWHCTGAYVDAIAEYFELPAYFSCRLGGFKREMLRDNQATAPVLYELPDGSWNKVGGSGPLGTRMKFPMPTASLTTRWCSSYLKISVMDAAIRNQDRFKGTRTLVVTGERAEESAARAKYKEFESHRTHTKARHVDHWRPVLHWDRKQVWTTIRKHGIVSHPAYYLGFGRTSCKNCIFLQKHDLATLYQIDRVGMENVANYEKQFGVTIGYDAGRKKQGLPQLNVVEKAQTGVARKVDPKWVKAAFSRSWELPIAVSSKNWELPSGAFGDLSGGSI